MLEQPQQHWAQLPDLALRCVLVHAVAIEKGNGDVRAMASGAGALALVCRGWSAPLAMGDRNLDLILQAEHEHPELVLVRAARAGRCSTVRLLVDVQGVCDDAWYYVALRAAAWRNHSDVVDFLLVRMQSDMDPRDALPWVSDALAWAAEAGSLDACKLMLQRYGESHRVPTEDRTERLAVGVALRRASRAGRVDTVRLLLEYMLNPLSMGDENDADALPEAFQQAVDAKHLDVVHAMLPFFAQIDAMGVMDFGEGCDTAALVEAARTNDLPLLDLLLTGPSRYPSRLFHNPHPWTDHRYGHNHRRQGDWVGEALMQAAYYGNLDSVKHLVRSSQYMRSVVDYGSAYSVLEEALECASSDDVVRVLKKYKEKHRIYFCANCGCSPCDCCCPGCTFPIHDCDCM